MRRTRGPERFFQKIRHPPGLAGLGLLDRAYCGSRGGRLLPSFISNCLIKIYLVPIGEIAALILPDCIIPTRRQAQTDQN